MGSARLPACEMRRPAASPGNAKRADPKPKMTTPDHLEERRCAIADPTRNGEAVTPHLATLLEKVRQTAHLPLDQATTLPPAVYTDPDFLTWETENVLRPEWLGVCHLSQIPAPGDFLKLDLLGEPLIAVHGKDGQHRVLSRVCPHRNMDIMPASFAEPDHGPAEPRGTVTPDHGHTRLFLCPYHHWSFDLDGSLKGCPEMHQATDFHREDHPLTSFSTEIWNGFLFVNLDGKAEPLADQYDDLDTDIAGWRTADMDIVIERQWDCDFNWKVLVENFMEPYHHLGTHAKTLQPIMPAKGAWTAAERPHSIALNLPLKDPAINEREPALSTNFPLIDSLPPEHRDQWSACLGYPSFLLFAGPDRMIWYRIDPVTADRSRLLTTVLVHPETKILPDYETRRAAQEQMLVDFHLEDMEACTAVQRGLHSRTSKPGRLSHLEMPLWLFQRYLAARADGTWPTIQHPAAPAQSPRR